MRRAKVAAAAVSLALATVGLTGCVSDADRVSENLSTDAEQFKVQRRITIINNITDRNMLTIEGLCSFEQSGHRIDAVCKTGPSSYVKDVAYMGDNATALIEQATEDASQVSKYHYKVVLKPENALPSFDVELGGDGQ